jgi:osmotically inducible protein OsmC
MALAERSAEAIWQGTLREGKGSFTVGSGALSSQAVTWAARTESSDGKTSPEELIAAANASCFSMALSNALTLKGSPPEELRVNAVCTLDRVDGKLKITMMDLDVTGRVPGISASDFEEAAQEAGKGCPVSGALKGNVEINVTAQLES